MEKRPDLGYVWEMCWQGLLTGQKWGEGKEKERIMRIFGSSSWVDEGSEGTRLGQ